MKVTIALKKVVGCFVKASLSYLGMMLFCVFGSVSNSFAQNSDSYLTKEESQSIHKLLFDIVGERRNEVVEHISYPLDRQYPLSSINDKSEMLKYYDTVFTDELKNLLSTDPDLFRAGWRGVSICNGLIWGDFEEEGLFKIYAINYFSSREELLWKRAIEERRSELHASLREFILPMCIIHTKRFTIMIDKIAEGDDEESIEDDTYRYVCWKAGQRLSDVPDLVLSNGVLSLDGTMQVFTYTFTNAAYRYCIDEFGGLNVYKNDTLVLHDDIK